MKRTYVVISMLILLSLALAPGCTSQCQKLPATIPVGCLMPVSAGPAAGPNLIKAAQYAIGQVNAGGGIDGKKLELLVEDEGPTAATALYAVHKLVEEKKVQVVIGGTTSDAVVNIAPYLAGRGVLLVSPSATSVALAGQDWSKWVYRVCPSDSLQGGVIAGLIKERGLKKVAILVQDTVYGRGVEQSASDYIKGLAEVVISLHYDPAKLSYLSELNSIKDAKPDCVLQAGLYSDSAVVFAQALKAEMGSIPWICADGAYDMPLDKYLESAKFMQKAVTGAVAVPDKQSEAYRKFADGYKVTYNIDPTVYCDTTYDAVNLVAAALKKVSCYNGGDIGNALAAAGLGYPGASGSITFDQSGERIAGLYGIWKVEQPDTQYKYVITGQSVYFIRPR